MVQAFQGLILVSFMSAYQQNKGPQYVEYAMTEVLVQLLIFGITSAFGEASNLVKVPIKMAQAKLSSLSVWILISSESFANLYNSIYNYE